jgi:hypothetical protein
VERRWSRTECQDKADPCTHRANNHKVSSFSKANKLGCPSVPSLLFPCLLLFLPHTYANRTCLSNPLPLLLPPLHCLRLLWLRSHLHPLWRLSQGCPIRYNGARRAIRFSALEVRGEEVCVQKVPKITTTMVAGVGAAGEMRALEPRHTPQDTCLVLFIWTDLLTTFQ